MGNEINLMINYPRTKRDISQRLESKTEDDRTIARKFGKEFFDGNRKTGYGGFHYNSRFWEPVIPTFQKYYNLTSQSSILDVGCAKGFMLYDFKRLIPDIEVEGIDISEYAIKNAFDGIKDCVHVANAIELPYEDKSFDLIISITTVHNFDRNDCITALKEIERVSKKNSFLTVDAYRNNKEKDAMHAWNLTAKTMLHVDEWKELFDQAGYTGDYYWFIP